ncbi:hypothetical protein FS749_006425 [Ceratobasidium sp. UAMH 11750]|nr:hypothetical protein FS749_006425 [Ceratobasidium sp. UAMH 11750]
MRLILIVAALSPFVLGQRTATLGLANGYLTLDIGSSTGVRIVKDAQVLASFKPSTSFDFAPFDKLSQRQYDGYVSSLVVRMSTTHHVAAITTLETLHSAFVPSGPPRGPLATLPRHARL